MNDFETRSKKVIRGNITLYQKGSFGKMFKESELPIDRLELFIEDEWYDVNETYNGMSLSKKIGSSLQ